MSNVTKLYMIRFFQSLIPAYVIERLFWEMRGMTIPMVVMTEILFALTIVVLEIPTGIIADKWGRKRMLLVAAVIGCLEFLLLLFSTEFWHFALVVLLTAVAASASSGADNAMLYDSLKEDGRQSSFERIVGRMNALDIVSITIAALSGSLLAGKFGFSFNYWLSFASMLIALGFTLTLREPSRGDGEGEAASFPIAVYVKESLAFFRRHPGIYPVILTGIMTGAAINFVDEFWQLYLERHGIPVAAFGVFSAALFFARLPGNLIAYKLKEVMKLGTLLILITAVLGAGFVYLALARDWTGLIALFAVCVAAGVIEPLAAGYLHHRIDSGMRATIDSFQSLGLNAALVATGIGFGYFASGMDLFGGFGFIGFVCAVFLLYLLAIARRIR
ncbi:MFS transporter [Paenibacillus sp. PAMC21692]|uniref:MFS transporter n=1 Tax=Paenibacillus sp. PAMC21692 TaxID=2762320 RepID=UPI00164D25A2|nr:MFS transporter [Paenibacillus sp. PAMC21692]QNK59063.1 MFS transporter [Paenibacillus sp. PAMC21692]